MQTKTYITVDRAGWPKGPWDSEPDKVQFPDPTIGLPCLAVRNRDMGHWCGYVGVPPGHPLHGKHYDDVDADVHGGLTFADSCTPGDTEEHGICHTPDPGEPEHVWWFGFDCAHSGDSGPSQEHFGVYRTLKYVKEQCANLARQLA